ncbi:ABC transporter ATP-binding protein [Microbacterium sp. KR10-403]|uniref:ABC transporter ATP-binding protein n=1 Tax=Microbacterium sp. KR10-403 TaxID=3158581 RepID=UPI0032E45ED6
MADLVIDDLVVTFGHGRRSFTAVDGVSLTVPHGRIVGLVGESGSGKSTVARTVAGFQKAVSGSIRLGDRDLLVHRGSARERARDVQMVFQDPYSSLNPRMTVGETLAEALTIHLGRDGAGPAAVGELLELVRLKASAGDRYPAQLSGGMRQRVAIARCLAVRPQLIVADEITSALDASVQGAVLNLIRDLQRELGLSVLFITHNLAAVRYIADTTAVMRHGQIVETGDAAEIVAHPRHDYTRSLVAAIPRIEHAGTDHLLTALEATP